jgi:hypothetical protein
VHAIQDILKFRQITKKFAPNVWKNAKIVKVPIQTVLYVPLILLEIHPPIVTVFKATLKFFLIIKKSVPNV